MTVLKTPAITDALGIPYWRVNQLIRSREFTPPMKDSSGDYVWLPEDVERLKKVLAARGYKRRQRVVA
jgi:hypothetical protein